MSIFVIGMNHKTASIALRETVYFALDKLTLYLQDLLATGHAREAMLLSTCNRSELYCEADSESAVRDWFCAQASLSGQDTVLPVYVYRDEEAVCHVMEVACGLDSMVFGEPQIFGQMKEAFSESCAAGAIGSCFHQLFREVFSIAKEIRSTTAIGACPVSVASAAVHLARQQVFAFEQANIALLGAGETVELLLRYLKNHGIRPMAIVNRQIEKAASLAVQFGGMVYGLNRLNAALAQADIVFSATGSPVPIVSKEGLMTARRLSASRPLVILDMAVPRDISPAVTDLQAVKLFSIDDLKVIIEKNRQGREHAADKAREMIHKKSKVFMSEQQLQDKVAHTIRAYRGQVESICRAELQKARQQLDQGADPEQVLEAFAYAYTKKLLHTPSVQLRQAGAEGRLELLQVVKQLFAISDPEIEPL